MSQSVRIINANLRKHLPLCPCWRVSAVCSPTGRYGGARAGAASPAPHYRGLARAGDRDIQPDTRQEEGGYTTLHTILHCFICFVFRDKLNPMFCRCAGLTWSRGGPRRGWVNHMNIFLVRIQIFLFQCSGEWAGVRGGSDQLGEQRGPGEGGQQGAHRHQDHTQQIPLGVPQLAASPHIPLLKHTSQSTCSYLKCLYVCFPLTPGLVLFKGYASMRSNAEGKNMEITSNKAIVCKRRSWS